ncbi:DUF2721 domain-containing protein [Anatilimnocola sp. NA78]|uniref:DUF2721 domain-containing protein n=1 Tax=Anatilimnocola sp. NA78 TaxID=3415683 RepID=UPI003CE554A3
MPKRRQATIIARATEVLHPVEVLAALITPGVLISATALLLLSTANRLGRVNDRTQALLADLDAEKPPSNPADNQNLKDELILKQLASLLKRLLLLRSAVTGMYVSIALLVVTSITAGLHVIIPQIVSMIPISLAMLGAMAFLYSIVLLIREAAIAVHTTLEEIAYAEGLVESRKSLRQQK